MDTTYKAGTVISAHCEPNAPLIINRYLDRIYYCEAVNDPTHKLLAYFERELIPPAPPIETQVKLYIKYMVSMRCKMIVKDELTKLGLHFVIVDLGLVEILEDITESQREQLKVSLLRSGLELMDDKKAILIEKIKNVIIEIIHYTDETPRMNYSDYISEKTKYDYTYLSNIFSEVNGITIQQFIIIHKIERVKELLLYDELNLSEIAHKLHYSSVAHLSNQFKKETGLSPSFFKKLKQKRKDNIENL